LLDLPNNIKSVYPNYEKDEFVKIIIAQAERGEFHDFKSRMYICPKLQLASMLLEADVPEFADILEDIYKGIYDEKYE
jgi:hypothetical protein